MTRRVVDGYAHLQSTLPAGAAEEAFRLPASPTRAQESLLNLVQGDAHGELLESEGQNSGDRGKDGSFAEVKGRLDSGAKAITDPGSGQEW